VGLYDDKRLVGRMGLGLLWLEERLVPVLAVAIAVAVVVAVAV
jgi:hypothetical protein